MHTLLLFCLLCCLSLLVPHTLADASPGPLYLGCSLSVLASQVAPSSAQVPAVPTPIAPTPAPTKKKKKKTNSVFTNPLYLGIAGGVFLILLYCLYRYCSAPVASGFPNMNPMMQQQHVHHPQLQQQQHHAPAIDPFGGLTAQRAQGLRSEEEARREKRARERDARLRRAEQQMAAQQQSRFMALKHSMMRKQEEEAMTAQMAAETARLEQEVAAQQAMLETQQMEMQTAMMEQQLAAQQQQLAGMQQASSTNGYPNQSGGGSFNSAGSSFAGQPTAAGGMYGDLALAPSMGGGGGGGDNNFRPATTSAAYGTIV